MEGGLSQLTLHPRIKARGAILNTQKREKSFEDGGKKGKEKEKQKKRVTSQLLPVSGSWGEEGRKGEGGEKVFRMVRTRPHRSNEEEVACEAGEKKREGKGGQFPSFITKKGEKKGGARPSAGRWAPQKGEKKRIQT